jgi:DNA-binding NarL/FixJ family response regulator
VHPEDRERVLSEARGVRTTGVAVRDEYRYIARDGRTVWVGAGQDLRAREVAVPIADGLTNEKVAATLSISPETVQSHVRNAMAKLQADTRTEAVATALRRAIIA